MSRLDGQKYYTRWKNSTLHKSCSYYWIPTSEDELLTSLLPMKQHHEPLKESSMKYCLCGKQFSRRKSSSSSYESRDIKILKCLNCQKHQHIQKNLELHLAETQVKEALAEDKQTALIQHLDLTTAALEALIHYGQSLQVSQLAVCRVCNISHRLILSQTCSTNSKSESIHLIIQLQQLENQTQNKLSILKDLVEHCSKDIVLSKYLYGLMNDNYTKKKDLYIATKNFRKFLSTSKLSVPQMEKLNRQYNTILNDYQQSRHILDLELPKAINTQLTAVEEGFKKFREFYNDTNDNKIVTLFKLIEEKLCKDDSNSVATVSQDHLLSKSDICQKCKIHCMHEK